MKIKDLLTSVKPTFSFEFFPPKTDEDVQHLLDTASSLKSLKPAFISVTWGAGGSTRRKTIDIVTAIKNKLDVEAMAHLTCVGASVQDLDFSLEELRANKIENILALRGDPPKGETVFTPTEGGFRFARDLVAHIKGKGGFCVGAAAYPEGHVETPDKRKDLRRLVAKVDAGADFLITQLFFDNRDYFEFCDRAQESGISVPIIPGIMPITNVSQIKRFTSLCGATIPPHLLERLEVLQEDREAVVRVGIEHATLQCRELLRQGAPGIHFYTLNRSHSTAEILINLRTSTNS